jgi:tRNA(fMet)-specific endonuclease VapC
VIERAAIIYTDLYRRGQLISDADILIGATALANDCRLITNNERHLRRIPGLIVENWLSAN